MPIPPPPPSAGTPSASVSCKKGQFILYYVFPDGTEKLAFNAKYKIFDLKTGAVMAEGTSDEHGLTTEELCGKPLSEIRIHTDYAVESA